MLPSSRENFLNSSSSRYLLYCGWGCAFMNAPTLMHWRLLSLNTSSTDKLPVAFACIILSVFIVFLASYAFAYLCVFYHLMVNMEGYPFLDNLLPILMDESNGFRCILRIHRLRPLLLPSFKANQLRILKYDVEDTFFASMFDMNMNRVMLIWEEIEDKSEVFEDFSHSLYLFSDAKLQNKYNTKQEKKKIPYSKRLNKKNARRKQKHSSLVTNPS